MSCKHAFSKQINIPTIGTNQSKTIVFCRLKQESQLSQVKIYQELFKLGFEGSMLNDECPMFIDNNWGKCPFSEK